MPEGVLSLLGMLLTVGVVLVLAYWCTKLIAGRGIPGLARSGSGSENMCLLWQLHIGKNERLVLLRVHSRCLLLGVTGGGIQLLAELTEDEAAQWLEKPPVAGESLPSFSQVLKGSFLKKK